jgi:uncharacterized membrane protein YoaK (UPF0700 family)
LDSQAYDEGSIPFTRSSAILETMPSQYLHSLTSPIRTKQSNFHLGAYLAFVAGAINAGGFLAISRYTSHMTGIVSAMADEFVLGNAAAVAGGAALLAAFVAGSATTAILVNWGLRRQLHGAYSLPLLFEALFLLLFGLVGMQISIDASLAVPLTALILCFLMGLQNATITKISGAEIRTTHMTGIVTDIGIELGRLVFRNMDTEANKIHVVKANRQRLRINLSIFSMFLVGGVFGAVSFKYIGYGAVLPLALSLVLVSLLPVLRDLRGK